MQINECVTYYIHIDCRETDTIENLRSCYDVITFIGDIKHIKKYYVLLRVCIYHFISQLERIQQSKLPVSLHYELQIIYESYCFSNNVYKFDFESGSRWTGNIIKSIRETAQKIISILNIVNIYLTATFIHNH